MSLQVPEDLVHRLTVSGLERAAVIECAALFTGGTVQRPASVTTEHFAYEFSPPAEGATAITMRRISTGWLYIDLGFVPLYTLWLGFQMAGCEVKVKGPWAEHLAGGARRKARAADAAPGIRVPLERRFDYGRETPRPPAIDPAHLVEIHETLITGVPLEEGQRSSKFRAAFPRYVPTKKEKPEITLIHRSGLKLLVGLGEDRKFAWHRYPERRPASLEATFFAATFGRDLKAVSTGQDVAEADARTLRSLEVQPARTFGEALLALDKLRLGWTTLEVLPGEVAIIAERHVGRFSIEDRTTLDSLDTAQLGEGRSELFPRAAWIVAARQAEEIARPYDGLDYWEQAARFAKHADEQAADRAEIERLQAIVVENEAETRRCLAEESAKKEAKEKRTAELAESVAVGSFQNLIGRLDPKFAPFLEAFAEDIKLCEMYSDGGRYQTLAKAFHERLADGRLCELRYVPLQAGDLLQLGIPNEAFEHFGYRDIQSTTELEDFFTITCGKDVFWGNTKARCVLYWDQPCIVYFV